MLVLAALTLVTIDARSQGVGVLSDARNKVSDVFSPLQRATHAALRPFGNFITGAFDYGSLKHENEALRRQLAQTQTDAAVSEAERQEAEEIIRNAGQTVPGDIPTLTTQIIDLGPSNFDNTVVIDKGTANGVAVGQSVVAAGGLVGVIQSAEQHVATVELLTDPSFVVGVTLKSGNIGSASGTGRSLPMRITVETPNVNPTPAEKVGDPIVTSGLSGEKFPKGIPIGKVSKVIREPGATEPEIEVTPYINPNQLSYLEVLLWSPP